ncbi:MAG: GNAT family N-acetyltransferase [Candidatus Hodarchaeales archaeon]
MSFATKIIYQSNTDEVKEFMTREWQSSNLENFGRNISEDEWNSPFTVLLYINREGLEEELVGVARCNVVGKTVRLSQLLVKTEYRRHMKIGTQILREIELLCIKNKWHKIRLSTSENHNNLGFYQKNGFKVEATLKNDAFGLEWYILSKFIEF